MRNLSTMPVTFAHLASTKALDIAAIHAAALETLKRINTETRTHAQMA